MKYAQRGIELFTQRPAEGNRLDWLANQLLQLTIEAQTLSLRFVSDTDGRHAVECTDAETVAVSTDAGPQRVFRTLLARLAKMAEEETGAELNPYGGTLYFDRSDPSIGPVQLTVSFVNTSVEQCLQMTCSLSAHRPQATVHSTADE